MRRGQLLIFAALVCLTSCVVQEPRPPGVSRSIAFFVTPLYPHSNEIVVVSLRGVSPDVLKDAWRKKARMVAGDRRFKTTELVVHDSETVQGGWPMGRRTVTGTMTFLD
ncbi:MAG TPA: hypothetical protein VE031_06735 [Chthoniobacterales bacterium]|nr:hypothetical protein [Chthoniobacterales bacterium]